MAHTFYQQVTHLVSKYFFPLLISLVFVQNAHSQGSFEIKNQHTPSKLELEDLSGDLRSLDEFQSKLVIVNFWATWCPPCIREFPSFERLKQNMADQPLEILAVNSGEPKSRIKRYRRLPKKGITVLLDPTEKATRNWKVDLYPTTFIIGPDGNIVRGIKGENVWDSVETINLIEELLPDQPGE
jgi:thiol-disulfide isomerase/thioredoxin